MRLRLRRLVAACCHRGQIVGASRAHLRPGREHASRPYPPMANRIEDYALIGDCETAALVGRDGSIDWLCWPRFDSAAVFAALLGDGGNGHWRIAAVDEEARVSRRYRGDTLILETEIVTADGAATVIDFMPLRTRGGSSHIIRMIAGRHGRVAMHTRLVLRFDYGTMVPWVTRLDRGTIKAIAGPDMAVLRTDVDMQADGFSHRAQFTVNADDRTTFVLGYAPSFQPLPEPLSPVAALEETEQAWAKWSRGYQPAGNYADEVLRSLITLKGLTYRPTGGIVAAPTTSLPEKLGGTRNWDYRYCWLRDATFTLLALMNSGYTEEASAWYRWLLRAAAGSPANMQIMYGIMGQRRLLEWEASWLPGYEGAQPVRVGNAAHAQLQLDVYGELIDAFHQSRIAKLKLYDESWSLECTVLDHVAEVWD